MPSLCSRDKLHIVRREITAATGGVDGQKAHLGTETVKITALAVNTPGAIPPSFNVASRDQFNIVRVGLNYQFH
jgi:hypothetical protein